eukprot:jgi/Galph1/3839/GphlegSOOS_G2496.1
MGSRKLCYLLTFTVLLYCLCEVDSIDTKDGSLKLDIRYRPRRFEASVLKDRVRWASRTESSLREKLEESDRKALYMDSFSVWKQKHSSEIFSNKVFKRYDTVSLGGNVEPDGGYYVELDIGGQKTAAQIDTGSCVDCSSEGMIHLGKSASARIVPCNASSCTPNTCSSQLCVTGQCSQKTGACCLKQNGISGCFFLLVYGTGAAAGVYFKDDVRIGSLSSEATIGGILYNFSDFPVGPATGVLGMAFKGASCNPSCATPLFDDIVKTNNIENVFSVRLKQSGGELVLGGIDNGLYTGSISYIPLINGVTSVKSAAVVDTGTTTLVLDSKYFKLVENQFQKRFCDIPNICSNSSSSETIFSGGGGACALFSNNDIEKLPNITIELATSFRIELSPKDYMIQVPLSELGSPNSTFSNDLKLDGQTEAYCLAILDFPGLESSEGYSMILGDTVLEKFYVVFDRKQLKVGFAPAS